MENHRLRQRHAMRCKALAGDSEENDGTDIVKKLYWPGCDRALRSLVLGSGSGPGKECTSPGSRRPHLKPKTRLLIAYGVILIASTTNGPCERPRGIARKQGIPGLVSSERSVICGWSGSRAFTRFTGAWCSSAGPFISLCVWHVRITPADATN